MSPLIDHQPPESISNNESLKKQSLTLVKNLISGLYPDNIPPAIQQRLNRLEQPGTVIQSTEKLHHQCTQRTGDSNTNPNLNGYYDAITDQIYLKDDADLSTYVHEYLHLLSTSPFQPDSPIVNTGYETDIYDENNQIIISQNSFLNEGITSLFTIIATEQIDINDQKIWPKLISTLQSEQPQTSLAYTTSVDNLVTTISRNPVLRKNGLNKLLNAYLNHSPQLFPELDQFQDQLHQIPDRERTRTAAIFSHSLESLIKDDSLPANIKDNLASLLNLLQGNPDPRFNLNFVYPQNTTKLIDVKPPINLMGVKNKPEIVINLALGKPGVIQMEEFRKLLGPNQMEIFLLWQSIKMDSVLYGKDLTDNQFFDNSQIIDYLKSKKFSPTIMAEIFNMARQLLNSTPSNDLIESLTF